MPRPGVKDPFRRQARAEGYLSRAVYKLKAIDAKYRLFKAGQRVLDLGCSPGSWLQYVGQKVGPGGLVVGVDVNPPQLKLAPPLYFLAGDIQSLDLEALRAVAPSFQVVVSDLAPRTTGNREVDAARSLTLARAALKVAQGVLQEGGHFLVKVFESPDLPVLLAEMQGMFASCHRLKPPGSRPASRELYLLGWRKKPASLQR